MSGSDSACCLSSNLADNTEIVDIATEPFQIDHWSEAEGDVQPNDINFGVFNQDNETAPMSSMANTIRLEFPKFSKGLKASDFNQFVQKYVGEENLEKLENWKYPNVWIIQVKTQEIHENLLRVWKTKIKNKTCWINPFHDYELRGFLHWLPHFVSDDDVKRQLSQFGEVLFLENEVHDYWNGEIKSEVKSFALRLKDGMVKNDLPHFLKFGGYRTLVIVRGRKPACFHCREFGHNKKDCKKYKEKLDEYCKNPEARRPRTKPRGRRHRPDSDAKHPEDKYQNETNSILTGSTPAQKCSGLVKSCLNPTHSDRKSTDEKKEVEILAILQSLKEWKEEITEMVERTVKNIEENYKMKLTSTELVESDMKEETIKFLNEIISKVLDNTKEIATKMREQTLNVFKGILVKHFGLDSDEPLDKLISHFENRKQKLGPNEEKFTEE